MIYFKQQRIAGKSPAYFINYSKNFFSFFIYCLFPLCEKTFKATVCLQYFCCPGFLFSCQAQRGAPSLHSLPPTLVLFDFTFEEIPLSHAVGLRQRVPA